jgi:Ran GTPase-activating protein (RanGAP) involved in mRNA processing and transport
MRNNIGPKGAKYLKELLITNKFLAFLDVSGNVLCDQGIYQLSLGLKQNDTIQVLNLSRNGITNFGIDFLREAFQEKAKL